MSDNHVQRTLGQLEARQDSTDERLERIEHKLDTIVEAVARGAGGWKMLLSVGSLAMTVAGFVGAWAAKLWPGVGSDA